ncbi:uncharacterized protein G2W53_015440 [Senna tora]|uniref:Uncharacterized protein n=1 Tax=Senna tora TaxID=362788 RepID=A0A834WVI7_9FABA|nr:uncharacterized protein G2W53_015440 [Senna tora]
MMMNLRKIVRFLSSNKEGMTGLGRGRGGRGGKVSMSSTGRGRRDNQEVSSTPRSIPLQEVPRVEDQHQISPVAQRGFQSFPDIIEEEIKGSQIGEGSINPSAGSCTSKAIRGKYKSLSLDMKTRNGQKVKINIPEGLQRAVGLDARDIASYCGFVLRQTVSFRVGRWQNVFATYGQAMCLKVKVVSERNKRNRAKQVIRHTSGPRSFAEVEELTRDPTTGEKERPMLQHTHKTNGGRVWLDPKSKEIHGRLKELVSQQKDNQHPLTGDEILESVLGEKSGYVRGKGYGKKPITKRARQQIDVEASVSSTIEVIRDQMQAEFDRKLQEDRVEYERKIQDERVEYERKLQEERNELQLKDQEKHAELELKMQDEIDQRIQAQLNILNVKFPTGNWFIVTAGYTYFYCCHILL